MCLWPCRSHKKQSRRSNEQAEHKKWGGVHQSLILASEIVAPVAANSRLKCFFSSGLIDGATSSAFNCAADGLLNGATSSAFSYIADGLLNGAISSASNWAVHGLIDGATS